MDDLSWIKERLERWPLNRGPIDPNDPKTLAELLGLSYDEVREEILRAREEHEKLCSLAAWVTRYGGFTEARKTLDKIAGKFQETIDLTTKLEMSDETVFSFGITVGRLKALLAKEDNGTPG